MYPDCPPVVIPGTLRWQSRWTVAVCVPRWTAEGPRNLRGTQNCRSVLHHPTPRPTPRWGLRLPTHRPRSVPGGRARGHIGLTATQSVPFIISDVFLLPRVWSQTPSQRSTCPCSRSKSWHTRSAPTRGPPPWTGPRRTSSSATYRTSHLVHLQIFQKWFWHLNVLFCFLSPQLPSCKIPTLLLFRFL